MQCPANQLSTQLQRGLKSLYTLHGDEQLLLQEAADSIRAEARANGFSERTVHTVMGARFDWSTVLADGGSMSLFADKQILEIRIPGGAPGKEGSAALQRIAESAKDNDSTLTIITLPRLDKQTKSGAWFSALDGFGTTVQIESVERAQLPLWIAQRLAMVGLKVKAGEAGQRTLQFFADQVEGNLLAAHQEIQKLALLYADQTQTQSSELSFEQIESCVLNVARYDVYKLPEAVLSGQMQRAHRMLEGLEAEGEKSFLVLNALSEDVRALRRVKQELLSGRPLPMALREQRVWGNRERLFERVLPRMDVVNLDNLLQSAHIVDGIVKGIRHPNWPTDGWQALHRLAQQMCIACMGKPIQGKSPPSR